MFYRKTYECKPRGRRHGGKIIMCTHGKNLFLKTSLKSPKNSLKFPLYTSHATPVTHPTVYRHNGSGEQRFDTYLLDERLTRRRRRTTTTASSQWYSCRRPACPMVRRSHDADAVRFFFFLKNLRLFYRPSWRNVLGKTGANVFRTAFLDRSARNSHWADCGTAARWRRTPRWPFDSFSPSLWTFPIVTAIGGGPALRIRHKSRRHSEEQTPCGWASGALTGVKRLFGNLSGKIDFSLPSPRPVIDLVDEYNPMNSVY